MICNQMCRRLHRSTQAMPCTAADTQRAHLKCNYGVEAQRPDMVLCLGPSSTMALQLFLLGQLCPDADSATVHKGVAVSRTPRAIRATVNAWVSRTILGWKWGSI